MAEGFARHWAPAEVEVSCASIDGQELDPAAVAVMAEVGIDISKQRHHSLADLDMSLFDLVVTLTEEARHHCLVLPGAPAVVRWDIPAPQGEGRSGSREDYKWVRDQISRRIVDFFSGGYLSTIITLKRNNESVLDHFSEGIIVHDVHRHIIYFNQSAEKITGYEKKEVIGHDCHEIFKGGFCSGKCSFCNDHIPDFDRIQYPLNITTKDGQHKRVEMTVAAMQDEREVFQGVLASFRDVTEVHHLRHHLKTVRSFHGIVGGDEKMQEIYGLIRDLSASDCAVLVQGASGTGKELIAGAIHGESQRAGRAFVTVNCGALPEGILESELFGHVRGAFTGAIRDKKGRFELADGGTLFLDEVAELSPNMQVKLLRILQEGVFEPVGGEKSIRVDVRVISATNKDLRKLVRQGKFREDLFYRLCVVPVNIPPLQERRNDIPLMVNQFINRFSQDLNAKIDSIDPQALHQMLDYPWPGNVRELQNAIQYAFVKCKDNVIRLEHLPPEIITYHSTDKRSKKHRGKLSLEAVEEALKESDDNKGKAAQLLGVGRTTLYRFMKAHGLSVS